MGYEKYQQLKEIIKDEQVSEKLGKKNVILFEQDWKADNSKICEKCGRKENLTLDHIIPKQIVIMFGIDLTLHLWRKNFQTLCKICNLFKMGKLDFSNPKTKPLLLELINALEDLPN